MNTILAALVNGAILGALLTSGLWLALSLAPRRTLNAATRYALWWAMLGIAVALPMLYLPVRHSVRAPAVSIRSQTPTPIQRSTPRVTPVTRIELTDPPATPSAYRPAVAVRPIPVSKTAPSIVWPTFPLKIAAARWPRWVFAGWACASLFLLLRLALSCVMLDRLRARAIDAPGALRAIAIRGAARRGIRVASSPEISIPVAVGPRRPSILIPSKLFGELDASELEQVALHEAAHLARRDDYALLAQRILETLFVWHPVVWWIVRRIDLEREIACDDLVIAATGQPRSYASCLARIVELSAGVRSSLAAATAADDTSHLARRVDMLLDKKRHFGTRLLKGRFAAIAAMLAALVWVASETPALVAFAIPRTAVAAQNLVAQIPKLLMFSQAAAPASEQTQDAEGLVVEDSSGVRVASAELRFHKAGMRELAADLDTDGEGRFRAAGLPPGEYTVDISKPNYITTTLKLRVPVTGLGVRLVRYGVIDGQVNDAEGRPIPGRILSQGGPPRGAAYITILVKAHEASELRQFRRATLDDNGHFRVFDLPPGEYAVGLWYNGLNAGSGMQLYPGAGRPQYFTVAGGEEYRDINFLVAPQPSFQVSGKIELPKPKVQFQIALGLPDQPTLPIAQAMTDDDGNFRLEKVPVGTYDVFVAGPSGGHGFLGSILRGDEPLFGRTRIQVSGQNIENLNVPVSPGRSINVVLRAQGTGEAPKGCPQSANLMLESLEPWWISPFNIARASFGVEQAVRNLAPSRFRVSVDGLTAGCYLVNQPVVDLNGSFANPLVLELASAGAIHGTLKAGAAKSTEFVVVLLDAENSTGAETQLAFPDGQGRFAFEGLRPARYRVAAYPSQQASKSRWISDVSHMVEVDVPGGAAANVELSAEVKGKLP